LYLRIEKGPFLSQKKLLSLPERSSGTFTSIALKLSTYFEDRRQELKASYSGDAISWASDYFNTPLCFLGGQTPVECIANGLERLEKPEAMTLAEYDDVRTQFGISIMGLAAAQHIEDKSYYVSHDFNHGLAVAQSCTQILKSDDAIAMSLMARFELSYPQAAFLIEMVGLLHDIGYPVQTQQGLSKTNHSVEGARLLSEKLMEFLALLITDSPLPLRAFRRAILLHNSDKVSKRFDIRILTQKEGYLLANVADLLPFIEKYGDEIVSLHPANRSVAAQLTKAIPEGLRESIKMGPMGYRKGYEGRSCDIYQFDGRMGLEFSEVDLIEQTLSAVVRLADNMDIGVLRLNALQRHPTFEKSYLVLVGKKEEMTVAEFAEHLENTAEPIFENARAFRQWVRTPRWTEDERGVLTRMKRSIDSGSSLPLDNKVLLTQLKSAALDYFWQLDKNPEDQPLRAEMEEALQKNSVFGLRYYAGCLALKSAQFDPNPPTVHITVNDEKFGDLNQKWVTEPAIGRQKMPLGFYNIWRTVEAVKSIMHDGNPINVKVYSETGAPIRCPGYFDLPRERDLDVSVPRKRKFSIAFSHA
jgi:hypothetical protein